MQARVKRICAGPLCMHVEAVQHYDLFTGRMRIPTARLAAQTLPMHLAQFDYQTARCVDAINGFFRPRSHYEEVTPPTSESEDSDQEQQQGGSGRGGGGEGNGGGARKGGGGGDGESDGDDGSEGSADDRNEFHRTLRGAKPQVRKSIRVGHARARLKAKGVIPVDAGAAAAGGVGPPQAPAGGGKGGMMRSSSSSQTTVAFPPIVPGTRHRRNAV